MSWLSKMLVTAAFFLVSAALERTNALETTKNLRKMAKATNDYDFLSNTEPTIEECVDNVGQVVENCCCLERDTHLSQDQIFAWFKKCVDQMTPAQLGVKTYNTGQLRGVTLRALAQAELHHPDIDPTKKEKCRPYLNLIKGKARGKIGELSNTVKGAFRLAPGSSPVTTHNALAPAARPARM